jgi:hypothetical protein
MSVHRLPRGGDEHGKEKGKEESEEGEEGRQEDQEGEAPQVTFDKENKLATPRARRGGSLFYS